MDSKSSVTQKELSGLIGVLNEYVSKEKKVEVSEGQESSILRKVSAMRNNFRQRLYLNSKNDMVFKRDCQLVTNFLSSEIKKSGCKDGPQADSAKGEGLNLAISVCLKLMKSSKRIIVPNQVALHKLMNHVLESLDDPVLKGWDTLDLEVKEFEQVGDDFEDLQNMVNAGEMPDHRKNIAATELSFDAAIKSAGEDVGLYGVQLSNLSKNEGS